MSSEYGKLYVVATPIGNLADISFRAVDILKRVDLIAAEDTRHVRQLLQHYGINNKLASLHQHNEDKVSLNLLEKLRTGQSIALVSDAGTPLISDPGLPLIRRVREAGIEVSPVPGPCALIAALSASGLPVSRFTFEGFAPRTSSERKTFFQGKAHSPVTWAFYESSHRILASLKDLAEILPPDRRIVIARELTKLHETIVNDRLDNVLAEVERDDNMRKGEFVVIIEAVSLQKEAIVTDEQKKILTILLRGLSIKTAVDMAVEITGARKKLLYQAALELTERK
ncbi:MAG: 16S rRNA (cytidine(1402)-2'-O)-methyltransferase [Gammaproteobacteria bacterium]